MARPCKAVSTSNRKIGKEERELRQQEELKMRGNNNKVKPSTYLTKSQKKIFKYIVAELEESGILGNLDVFILDKCAIAIDRLKLLEARVNEDISLMFSRDFKRIKEAYDKDFFRCCNELSLSPQSRAKISNIKIQTTQIDPLMQILEEEDEEDDE